MEVQYYNSPATEAPRSDMDFKFLMVSKRIIIYS